MDIRQYDHLSVGFDQSNLRLVSAGEARQSDFALIPADQLNREQRLQLATARWAQNAWAPMWVGDRLIDAEALAALSPEDPLYPFLVDYEVRTAVMQLQAPPEPAPSTPLPAPPPPAPDLNFTGGALCIDVDIPNDPTQWQYNSQARQRELNAMYVSFQTCQKFSNSGAMYATIQSTITNPFYRLVSYTGHGNIFSISDYTKAGALLSVNQADLAQVASGKVFFFHCCSCCAQAISLGATMIKKGAKAVFGYEVPLIIYSNYIEIFCEAYYEAENQMLLGKTAGDALQLGKQRFTSSSAALNARGEYRAAAAMACNGQYLQGPSAASNAYGDAAFRL